VVCASTGNTSASAAAYAARAGLTCGVLIPEGYIASASWPSAHPRCGVLQIRGNFDEALELVRELPLRAPVTVVNSVNPYRIEGQKTGAFEIIDVLGDAPDIPLHPVGNAGNITAYWRATASTPGRARLQASAHARVPGGGPPDRVGHKVDAPDTIATAIASGTASWYRRRRPPRVRGRDRLVTDDEILEAYRYLASTSPYSASRRPPRRWPAC